MSRAIAAVGRGLKSWSRGTFFIVVFTHRANSADAETIEGRYYRVVALNDQEKRSVLVVAHEEVDGFIVFPGGDELWQFEMIQTLVAQVFCRSVCPLSYFYRFVGSARLTVRRCGRHVETRHLCL